MRVLSFGLLAIMLACGTTPEHADGSGSGGSSGGDEASGGRSSSGGSLASGGRSPSGGSSASAGGARDTAGGSDSSGGEGPSGSGGNTSGGSGGRMSANGGSSGSGGGSSECVANLACKLDPPPSSGDIHQDCVDRINQFLTQCACLPALSRRADGEDCADQMAEYDAVNDTPHLGVRDMICQPGGSQNECPGYASNTQVIGLCMQQMWDEGPPPTDPCTGSCFQEYGHFINMTDPSVTQVACGFYTTTSGDVWSVQNFSR